MIIWAAFSCDGADTTAGCDTPPPGSEQAMLLQSARSEAEFEIVYPCELPNSEVLASTAVTGEPGRQRAELVWLGPFEMTLRQSQFPPTFGPDPAGSARSDLDLFANVQATLLEANDASGDALYHLFWQQDDIHYELQVYGPPLQRRIILEVARSLE